MGNILLRFVWTRSGGHTSSRGTLSGLELTRSHLCSDPQANQVGVYSGQTGPGLRAATGRDKLIGSHRFRLTRRRFAHRSLKCESHSYLGRCGKTVCTPAATLSFADHGSQLPPRTQFREELSRLSPRAIQAMRSSVPRGGLPAGGLEEQP